MQNELGHLIFSTSADSQTGLANTKIRYLLQAQEGRASRVHVPACGKLTLPVLPEEESAVAKPDLISMCATQVQLHIGVIQLFRNMETALFLLVTLSCLCHC